MLLLRDFLLGFSIGIAFLPPAKAPMSAVIFSWSMSLADGMCANDFRDLGRVAGRVTSSREDMIASELEAQIFLRGELLIVHEVGGPSRVVILECPPGCCAFSRKQKQVGRRVWPG
jgi:hypothetical protein